MTKENPTNQEAGRAVNTKAKYSKSTHSEAQQKRLLDALKLRPHHSYELRKKGLYMVNTRVHELRKMGYAIETHRIKIVDDEGFTHHGIALYSLEGVANDI